ncbi:MAG: GerAB/ArcD/ProY family transporter [Clostridia bacterium]|nr:GerAB/ArcD/ProY family transporter [Clostridia bacterium]
MVETKVRAGGLYATAFAGAVVSAAAISPHLFGSSGYKEALLSVAVSLAVTSMAAVPALCLQKERVGLLEAARLHLGRFARVVEGFYFAVLAYFGFYFLAHFLIFMENTLNPATPLWLTGGCIVLTAAYGALRGLPTLCRAGTIAFVPMLLGFCFIFIALLKDIDTAYLLQKKPLQPVPGAMALFTAGRMTSLVHLLVFLPHTKGRKAAGFWVLNIGFHLVCALVVLFLALCLGSMAETQLFPVYTLALLANVGSLQRLDILFLVLWVVGAVLRLALDMTAASMFFQVKDRSTLGEAPRYSPRMGAVLLQAVLCAVPAVWVAGSLSLQKWLLSSQMITYISLAAGAVVPVFILCIERFNRCRKGGRSL